VTRRRVRALGLFARVVDLQRQDGEPVDDQAGDSEWSGASGLGRPWVSSQPSNARSSSSPGRCGAGWSGPRDASRRPIQHRLRRAPGFVFDMQSSKLALWWRVTEPGHASSDSIQQSDWARELGWFASSCQALVKTSCRLTTSGAESMVNGPWRCLSSCSSSVYGRTILTWGPSRRLFCGLSREQSAGRADLGFHASGGPMADITERFLCIASYEKGHDFLRQCAEIGVRPRCSPWTSCAMRMAQRGARGTDCHALRPEPRANSEHRFLEGADPALRPDCCPGRVRPSHAAEIREHMRIPAWGSPRRLTTGTNWPCGLRLEMPDFWFRSFAGC